MAVQKKSRERAEYGDFQTPITLARQVCKLLSSQGIKPSSVIEPTCGIGNFLFAVADEFPLLQKIVGLDVNSEYLDRVREGFRERQDVEKVRLIEGSFFEIDWSLLLRELPTPWLIIGNPPWVTNAELGTLGSSNVPVKTNFLGHAGLDAITGKGNFDISEWMLIQMLHRLNGQKAVMAMLCKTSVARKVLSYAWENRISLKRSEIYRIDAAKFFGAAVEACLLICQSSPSCHDSEASVFEKLADKIPKRIIGYHSNRLIANVQSYNRWKHLADGALPSPYKWRSGIKHDCAKVMELRKYGQQYRNGLGELFDLEDQYLYPMLKSSELAKGSVEEPSRWMLVTQRTVGEDTAKIARHAPKTWAYLQSHGSRLDRRASTIYRKRSRFSVFGVGDYSFAPWKVAISGFYKKLVFCVVGSFSGKPIVLDDTCYFVACRSKEEAKLIASLLNSSVAREFFSAFIFWDAKRPITCGLLDRLNLLELARELGAEATFHRHLSENRRAMSSTETPSLVQGELVFTDSNPADAEA